MRFNTFDEVVARYENTAPMISKHHTVVDDVRPIDDRKRKWERIKKISDTKYVLLDGNYGNSMFSRGRTARELAVAHEYENIMGPIVWERRSDGDYITITNHHVNHVSVTRYNFLHWYLPVAMRFHYTQAGKHFLAVGGQDFALPKNTVTVATSTVTGADKSLEFRVEADGTFTRTGELLKFPTQRVNLDKKKELKPLLAKVLADCALYAPMLDLSWDGRKEYLDQIRTNDTSKAVTGGVWWTTKVSQMDTRLTAPVLSDSTHELYLPMIALVSHDIEIKFANTPENTKRTRSLFNKLMNKVFNVYVVEEN